jgi:hypothetical protein
MVSNSNFGYNAGGGATFALKFHWSKVLVM